jgi:Uma2 family endonuclease
MFFQALGDRVVLWPQNPVFLSDLSMPQPDIVLLKPREDGYRSGRHPTPDEVLLLIEVADSSARIDRTVKAPLYARAGILEYWIVDLGGRYIEVFREPSGEEYRRIEELRAGTVSPIAFPDLSFDVPEILGTSV